MEYLPRNLDVLDGSGDLEHLHTFTNFPVYMGVESQQRDDDLLADMRWVISRSTGVIQLDPTLPLEIVYARSHGSGSVGGLWEQHHREFASFVARQAPTSVLEIGGGHGKLATYVSKVRNVDWTIIEPNPSPIEGCPARVIDGFFEADIMSEDRFDTVVHSHVLGHIYERGQFCSDIGRGLREGGRVIFSVPNMGEMLRRSYTNCLNFEHTFLLREEYVESLMKQSGFALVEKEYFCEDHSIFFCYRRQTDLDLSAEIPNLYAQNRQLFQSYLGLHRELVQSINLELGSSRSRAFLFGAHVFAQYLFAFGLKQELFDSILDNDGRKWGGRLSGSSLIVKSPEALANHDRPIVVLKAGVYNDEIRNQITSTINSEAIFIS